MGRFERSLELIRLCWGVLREDKELLVFPVVSGIAVAIVTASFIVPGLLSGYWRTLDAGGGLPAGAYVLIVLFYLVLYVVIIFFNAALVSAAMVRLSGGDPTLADGLRGAWTHVGAVISWAALAATVGLLLRLLRREAGPAGVVIAALGGLAWNVTTFLVIPILVVEDAGPIAAVKRSASLLRTTWGEQVIGNAGIGLIFGLGAVVVTLAGIAIGAVVAAAGAVWLGAVVWAATVLAVLVLSVFGATLHGIYSAALYRYAVGDDTVMFSPETLAGAFRPRRARRLGL